MCIRDSATFDDMKVLYGGFDLCSPSTSVSMTINGPAPAILAMFLNTAIDQRLDLFREKEGREPDVQALLDTWPARVDQYSGDELVYVVRGKEFHTPLVRTTLSGTPVRRVALPRTRDAGELVSFLRRENLPGEFPYTAGVFPFKREGEAPARMFAGEGDAFRTNRRFKVLSANGSATRLSTAFDSVTLYGLSLIHI